MVEPGKALDGDAGAPPVGLVEHSPGASLGFGAGADQELAEPEPHIAGRDPCQRSGTAVVLKELAELFRGVLKPRAVADLPMSDRTRLPAPSIGEQDRGGAAKQIRDESGEKDHCAQ